jgi:hypothetical protein
VRAIYLESIDEHKLIALAQLHLAHLRQRNALYFTVAQTALLEINARIVGIISH